MPQQLTLEEAIEEVRSGQAFGYSSQPSAYVTWALGALADHPFRVICLGHSGKVIVCGDPGTECLRLAGLRRLSAVQRNHLLNQLYQERASVTEEATAV